MCRATFPPLCSFVHFLPEAGRMDNHWLSLCKLLIRVHTCLWVCNLDFIIGATRKQVGKSLMLVTNACSLLLGEWLERLGISWPIQPYPGYCHINNCTICHRSQAAREFVNNGASWDIGNTTESAFPAVRISGIVWCSVHW